MVLEVGLEPTISALQERCITNYAIPANTRKCLSIIRLHSFVRKVFIFIRMAANLD